jgi:hypothetical protein
MYTVPSEEDFIAFHGEPVDNVARGLYDADPPSISEFNRESKLIDLELELAEAVHTVRILEGTIADLEKEDSID